MISSSNKRKLIELRNPALRMTRMLTDKAMAEAVGKMDMMKGDSPTLEELLAIIKPLIPTIEELFEKIKPLIPPPIKGDNYILTVKDKNEIASKIKPTTVDRVIERVEVPIITEKIVKEVKEVALNESAEKTRDKLESLKKGEKLTIQAIEDLADILAELRKWRGEVVTFMNLGGGGGFTSPIYNFIDDEVPNGVINGSNTVFTLDRLPYRGSVKIYRGGARQRVGEDYTFTNSEQKQFTFLIAPEVGEVLLADYRTL